MGWTWSGFPISRNKLLLLLLFFFVAVAGLSGGERFLGFFDDGPLPTPSSHQLHHVHDDAPPAPAPAHVHAHAHAHAHARSLGGGGGGLNSFIHYWFPPQPYSSRNWPELKFGWRIVVGTLIGFLGAALASIGGVGGGGIFVPMLTLIIDFHPKSSTALSKCMITGAAISTVFYNLRLRHPTLDLPIVDYDLALLFQPMLMLGISIGVAFNILFADWMVVLLLILLFLVTSTKAFFKGIETWKKETRMKKEAAKMLESSRQLLADRTSGEYRPLLGEAPANTQLKGKPDEVSVMDNICWKDLMLLMIVWVAFFAIQMVKQAYTKPCSTEYWILNSLQVPIAISVTLYEAINLYTGKRVISFKEKHDMKWSVYQLLVYCCFGILAGIVGGLLGLGGGFILCPLFVELGIPPQVASATSTFVIAFSSSMSVVQNYLLNRFPIPYAAYLVLVATIAAFVGQHIVRKLVALLGRASLIIFVLALTIFASAISLGGASISDLVIRLHRKEHMGFQDICRPS